MTQVFPAPLPGDTKRAYLVRNGLAIEGARGRFKAEAQALLDQHPDFQWADAPKPAAKGKATSASVPSSTPPAPAAPATQAPAPSGTTANLNAKEVRAWAVKNGVKVGERGRIHPTVIAAYVAATKPGGVIPQAKKPTPLDMPKVRRESTGFSVVGGILTSQQECGNAGKDGLRHGVSQCTCKGGPRAYSFLEREAGQVVHLTLNKPAL